MPRTPMTTLGRFLLLALTVALLIGPTPRSVAQDTTTQTAKAEVSDATEDGKKTIEPLIVHLHLTGALTEQPIEDPFGLAGEQGTSLRSLTNRLHKLAEDEDAHALVLTLGRFSAGLAQLEEVRSAIREVRDAGKPVYLFAEDLRAVGLAMLGDVDRVVMPPESMLWLTGFYGEALYLKNLMDKIGVGSDFITIAEYKSAAEMFTRDGPSEAAEANMNWLFDSWYGTLVSRLAEQREMSEVEVEALIDGGPYLAERALEAGLIDAVQSRDDFVAWVKDELAETHGGEPRINNRYRREGPKANFANPFALFSSLFQPPAREKDAKPAVGIVYVEGMIQTGYGQPSPFGGSGGAYSGDITHALDLAAEDDAVKAVVLRVDSPGGSATASEAILEATRRVQERKPVIVSMGNVAASGGYYVSCRADAILAEPTTATASIGVVAGKLVTAEMWDKLGIDWHPYQRGANADFFASSNKFREAQREKLSSWMHEVYDVFTAHVQDGRGEKLTKPLDEIARGRVFTGQQALDLGLVDELGGLSLAIERAAERAGLDPDDYVTRVVPKPKDFFTQLMEQSSGMGDRPSDLSVVSTRWFGAGASDTALPWLSVLDTLDPARAAAVRDALMALRLVGRERVAVVMPFALVLPEP